MFIATGVSLLLDPLGPQKKEIAVYTYTYLYTQYMYTHTRT